MTPPASSVVADLDTLVRLRQAAKELDLSPRRPTSSSLVGRRSSRFRGRGLDFDELRSYAPGDDVRRMDWRATARLGRPYIRSYREERDRPLFLLVDQRRTMFFGSRTRLKSVAAAELAALLAWRATDHGDRVGAILFGETRTWSFRAQRSAAHVQRICAGLVESSALLRDESRHPAVDFTKRLEGNLRLVTHDALVVVISDFRGLSDVAIEALRRVRAHNDLLLVWVTDPLERQLPSLGPVQVTNGQKRLFFDSSNRELREQYAAEYAAEKARIAAFVAGSGGLGFELTSDGDPVDLLRQVFLGRGGHP